MVESIPAARPRDDNRERPAATAVASRRPRLGGFSLRIAVAVIAALIAIGAASPEGSQGRVPVTFFIGAGDRGTGFTAADRDLAAWAFESWARESRGGLTLTPAVEEKARIRLLWVPLGSNLFGEMRRILVDGEPGAAVYVLPDLAALGADIASRAKQDPLWRDTIVFLTCVHEIGHALGLPHTADERDIMYSFGYGGDIVEYFMRYRRKLKVRADMRTVSALSNADAQALRALHPVGR